MAKAPTPIDIATDLSTIERVLLFCIAQGTDWSKLATHTSVRHLLVRNLIDRNPASSGYVLTPQGRTVLDALLSAGGRSGDR
jgi:hypothetical protein